MIIEFMRAVQATRPFARQARAAASNVGDELPRLLRLGLPCARLAPLRATKSDLFDLVLLPEIRLAFLRRILRYRRFNAILSAAP